MKIPGQSDRVAQSNALPGYEQHTAPSKVGELLGGGLEQLGSGVQAFAEDRKRVQEKARAEAFAVSHANADTAYQQAETRLLVGGQDSAGTVYPGYLESRGKEASDASAQVLTSLEKTRQKIAADTFKDPTEKARWLARNGGAYADTTRKVESHVATQRGVAAQDALEGQVTSTLQALAADPYGDSKPALERVQQSILALQKSPEGGKAAIQKFYADAAMVKLNGLLSQDPPDVRSARLAYDSNRQMFALHGPEAEAKIAQAEKVQAHTTQAEQNAVDAAQIVQNATPELGYADSSAAIEQLKKVPPAQRAEVTAQVMHLLSADAERQKNEFEKDQTLAHAAFNKGGLTAVPRAVLERLNTQYGPKGPDFVDRLQSEAEARYRRAKSDHTSDAAERRAQAKANRDAMDAYMALDQKTRAETDPSTWLVGRGVDNPNAFDRARQNTIQTIQKAGEGEAEFVRRSLASRPLKDKDPKKDKSKQQEYRAKATLAYQRFVLKEGRPPSDAEAEDLSVDLMLYGPGSFNPKDSPPEDDAPPRPTAKKVNAWVWSPDKKQRRPQYTDGSLGPVETP